MPTFQFWMILAFAFLLGTSLGCQGNSQPSCHVPAEQLLLRASGACLATIVKLEEHDDRPFDGEHWLEAWLEVEQGTGEIPQSLYLMIELGGKRPAELRQQQEENLQTMVLRHDSLKVGERHWFVFSSVEDLAKYPSGIVGWWRYDDRNVPNEIVAAIDHDSFADHPQWDEQRDVIYTWWQNGDKLNVRVREAGSTAASSFLFGKTFLGQGLSLTLAHAPFRYEIEPLSSPQACHVQVEMIETLPSENEFDLPAGNYHFLKAYDLDTGKLATISISSTDNIPLRQAFRQYDLARGEPTVAIDYQRMDTGGIAVGSDSPQWYRRIIRKYEAGKLKSEETFRHLHIKTGLEHSDSLSDWGPVSQ
ncbi:hypothetical protein [Bremerella cremea]|nr:hypothetical protein [Bremerella cremea]